MTLSMVNFRYAKRVNFWMKRYENFVGLTEVKAAQGKVVQMEKDFVETQELRRDLQMKVRVRFVPVTFRV